ncbi:sensor histidine kinase [Rhizobium ruizarguesonis]|uniref:histidine kinase n=1 Tax=Rhizobium ruizarguesonis TaxID=2081791 RepID=A0AAE8U2P6_9HYPH|nr:sensor histidine kinase [Rhizobium ruizarguesonis]TCA37502.1 HAMP domain-containing histidine kinase [Rhizobium leguminosarum bv. viciae]TAU00356.1 HAMP domain-containing histidine kinase [Rhizobium ruizarguesonis]TAX77138.1 HAMP domain-containing histidine kinase [Rhizobium ruizarguesonis]TAZ19692.1 HAMP domain-containing histidine kinase [Rhizobium ruizarguesonis]
MMAKAEYANPSLWWRLSWQLSIVFVAVVAAVIFGLCVYGATILSPNVALEDHITAVLARSVALDAQGQLEIRDTPELVSLKEQYDGLWYVAATTNGSSVSYGAIPAVYGELAHLTHLFEGADIRGSAGTDEIASVENVETAVGELRVLFGGVADRGWPVLALLGAVYPIYVSLLTVALPAVFLAVPRIVRRALARVSDVARKASEIEPRRYDARLPLDGIPKEVAPLVIAFNGALDRLENEFRKRQHFLIDAAHELRTPIAIMQTRIDGTPEGQDRRRLLDDVARLAETAEQLLDFERNNQAIDLHETIDLVEVARTVVADLAPLAIADGYQISFLNEAESLERRGSPSALPRAVSNLVRNAIDHGGNRGMITVSVSRAPSGGGRISVADEGPGIPAEHRELVFEPFYRVTPKSRGAGLGLSLVKQVAANHGGEVSIESSAAGTRVTIELA